MPIVLREEAIPMRLVVLRLGVNTLTDDALGFACATAFKTWDGVQLRGRITERDGDSVSVQVRIPVVLPQTA